MSVLGWIFVGLLVFGAGMVSGAALFIYLLKWAVQKRLERADYTKTELEELEALIEVIEKL